MTKLPKKFVVLFLFLSLISYLLLPNTTHAQVPDPYVSCDEYRDTEFHSLRPYQASPCNEDISEIKLYCGNDLIVKKTFKVTAPIDRSNCEHYPDGSFTCHFVSEKNTTDVSIDLIDAELPIMGNTQLVTNSQEQSEVLDDAEKVNEYVSWYLNGVINRAEYDYLDEDNPEDIAKLVDFSGPLNKLIPWEIQAQERIATIEKAGDSRHDQVAGCVNLVGKIVKCYPVKTENTPLRLSDWNDHKPPLPSDPKYQGENFNVYWKDYQKWRGKRCLFIPIPFTDIKFLQCFDDPTRPNYWADLFPYIPLSSTEDRKGEVVADLSKTEQPHVDDVNISNVEFESDNKRDYLYFSHMQEVSELAELLQRTYKAEEIGGFSGAADEGDSFYDTDRCDLADVRWNSGDDLFGEWSGDHDVISGTLSYTASFSCHFSPTELGQECKKDDYIALSVYTKTPKADEAWDRLVAGKQSIFKRLYPGAILEEAEIKDYPAVTTAKYEATNADEVLAGNPARKRSGERGEIFIPHVGGIQEYFLKGIQKALRPKGFVN